LGLVGHSKLQNFSLFNQRRFRFLLEMSGKNKVVSYATEETIV